MSAAANTIACIEELVGERLSGVLETWGDGEITHCKALVFESGRALVLGDNGCYWVAPAEDVQRRIAVLQETYERGIGALSRVLKLAGVGSSQPRTETP